MLNEHTKRLTILQTTVPSCGSRVSSFGMCHPDWQFLVFELFRYSGDLWSPAFAGECTRGREGAYHVPGIYFDVPWIRWNSGFHVLALDFQQDIAKLVLHDVQLFNGPQEKRKRGAEFPDSSAGIGRTQRLLRSL